MERDLQDNLTTTTELDKASLIEGLGWWDGGPTDKTSASVSTTQI
jgi:hypothetical protein